MALSDTDIDESIAADWKEIQAKHAVPEDKEPIDPAPAEEPAEPVEPEGAAPEDPEEPTEPARDASGKFVKQTKPKESPAAAATPEPSSDGSVPATARDTTKAPSSWRPTARTEWAKLSPAVQAEIHRREQDFQHGQTQLLPDAQFGKGLRQVIEPYRMLIEAEGGTPERAVADLLRTAAIFRVGTPQQKYQAVAQIAQQFGLDLTVFSPQGQIPPNQQQTFADPRVDQLIARQQQTETQRQQREHADMQATVDRWMAEVDDKGQPKRPYANDVYQEMSALIPQIRQQNPGLTHAQVLDLGYERAVWAHPEIRALLQQQAASDLEAKRRTENQQRVQAAKQAASVNTPRRASLQSPGKPGRLEDTIAEEARRLGLVS